MRFLSLRSSSVERSVTDEINLMSTFSFIIRRAISIFLSAIPSAFPSAIPSAFPFSIPEPCLFPVLHQYSYLQ
jgi:hypothetical protein